MPPPGNTAAQPELRTDSISVLDIANTLENELMELKGKYDMYFLGIDKQDPSKRREDLKKRIVVLKTQFIRNTGAKFRVGQLFQKFLTYERLWLKTLKEIEEGTYKREVFMARYRAKGKAGAAPGKAKVAATFAEDFDIDEAPASGAHAAPPSHPADKTLPHAAARPVAAQGGLDDQKIHAIYNAYMTAKKRCNESTDGITLEAVSSSLKKQIPKIMQEFGAGGVDFKVVIKDGKAVLKAVPRS